MPSYLQDEVVGIFIVLKGSRVIWPAFTNMEPEEKKIAAEADVRRPAGVEGLDDVLCGGFPADCFYLVQGDPGSGKTTLALQFLLEGLNRGESGLYTTLSETKHELLRVAHSHGCRWIKSR